MNALGLIHEIKKRLQLIAIVQTSAILLTVGALGFIFASSICRYNALLGWLVAVILLTALLYVALKLRFFSRVNDYDAARYLDRACRCKERGITLISLTQEVSNDPNQKILEVQLDELIGSNPPELPQIFSRSNLLLIALGVLSLSALLFYQLNIKNSALNNPLTKDLSQFIDLHPELPQSIKSDFQDVMNSIQNGSSQKDVNEAIDKAKKDIDNAERELKSSTGKNASQSEKEITNDSKKPLISATQTPSPSPTPAGQSAQSEKPSITPDVQNSKSSSDGSQGSKNEQKKSDSGDQNQSNSNKDGSNKAEQQSKSDQNGEDKKEGGAGPGQDGTGKENSNKPSEGSGKGTGKEGKSGDKESNEQGKEGKDSSGKPKDEKSSDQNKSGSEGKNSDQKDSQNKSSDLSDAKQKLSDLEKKLGDKPQTAKSGSDKKQDSKQNDSKDKDGKSGDKNSSKDQPGKQDSDQKDSSGSKADQNGNKPSNDNQQKGSQNKSTGDDKSGNTSAYSKPDSNGLKTPKLGDKDTGGLGPDKGYTNSEIHGADEQFDTRFTEDKGNLAKNKKEARSKLGIDDLHAAKPEAPNSKEEQKIPEEYKDLL